MKRGFARPTPERAPTVKPKNVVLPTPMSVPPPEGKPWWLVVVGVLVLGLVIAMVAMTVASGSRMFVGAGSIFPLFMIGGVMAMMMGGRGGSQQLSRPKLDALRAQFMLTLDRLRGSAAQSADSMDTNYRWFHPAPQTLAAAVGSPRMWERRPDNRDLNFGLVRVGVGMTQPEINWSEPQDMPADVDLEPVTGKALQEFGRYQSVVYNLPKMVSLLAEPWCSVVGPREQTLDLAEPVYDPEFRVYLSGGGFEFSVFQYRPANSSVINIAVVYFNTLFHGTGIEWFRKMAHLCLLDHVDKFRGEFIAALVLLPVAFKSFVMSRIHTIFRPSRGTGP